MFAHAWSTLRVLRMPMHLSSGHVTFYEENSTHLPIVFQSIYGSGR